MYRQPTSASAGAEQQYQFSAAPSSFGYTSYGSHVSNALENQYQDSPRHLSPRMASQHSPAHVKKASSGSHGLHADASRSMSPALSTATTSRHVPFKPTDRALPSRRVTPDTFSDAYAAFIMYCNPVISLDVDTQTLRTNFLSPPRSDNKEFDTFRLFELLQKFDAKEIKTWGQLALDLGVEAPDTSKGQSVQKVQQYTVRLKRWMRAMHVDAFFEYLQGKEHPYFTEIPPPSDPHPANGRDGVVAEEDLAIRALDPSFRPKRGRRRNSDVEHDNVDAGSAKKQPRLMEDTPQTMTTSAHPSSLGSFSAHLNSHDPWVVASAVTPQSFAPWAQRGGTESAATPLQYRWHINDAPQNPSSPHPMSAHPVTVSERIETSFENEPKSAVTPSTRRRKRHGPVVSSAWPSNNGPGSKPRGRPPASRNVEDGPFTTFPADPANDRPTEARLAAPVAATERTEVYGTQATSSTPSARIAGDGLSRPSRLSLQVPPHTGGPVRLATPPRVLLNGDPNDTDSQPSHDLQLRAPATIAERQRGVLTVDREIPGFSFEVLKRTLASVLLRSNITGRPTRLSGDEAKRLAESVLERFKIPRGDTDLARDDIARLTAASWLGVGERLNVPLGPATGQNHKVTVTRFRTDHEGYEEIVPADEEGGDEVREVFDLSWTASMGGCTGSFELKGLTLHEFVSNDLNAHDRIVEAWLEAADHVGIDEFKRGQLIQNAAFDSDQSGPPVVDDGVDWKSKYRALEFGMKMARGEFARYRERVIEKLFDTAI